MSEVLLIGGPLDGQTVEAEGRFVVQPMLTQEYAHAYKAWADEWLVAWTAETIMGIPEHPVTPPPPPYPEARHELGFRNGRVIGRYVDA